MERLRHVAWSNLKRNKGRTILLIISAAITSFILFSTYFLVHSLDNGIEVSMSRLGAPFIIVPEGLAQVEGSQLLTGFSANKYLSPEIKHDIEKLTHVESISPQLYLRTVSTVCCGTEGDFPVVAFDPLTDFTLASWMVDMRPLDDFDVVIGSAAGGVNYMYHKDQSERIDWINLLGEQFVVQDVLFQTGTEVDETIFMRLDTAQKLIAELDHVDIPKGALSALLINVRPEHLEHVQHNIEQLQENHDFNLISGLQTTETIERQVAPIRLVSYFMIILVVVMSCLQVMVVFASLIRERQKEVGMLRAMGVTKTKTYQLLLTEASYYALIGGGLGTFFAGSILYDHRLFFMQWFELPFLYPKIWSSALIGLTSLVMTWIVTLLGAFFPVRDILKQPPYHAIRKGNV